MLLTLDSSVIVAALRNQEPLHIHCRRIFDQLQQGQHTGVQPLIVLVEVAAAIRRRTGSADLADRAYHDLMALGAFRFVELDAQRAREAADIARQTGVRGMDAIVVQVAREFGSALVSIDAEMVERVQNLVTVQPVTTF